MLLDAVIAADGAHIHECQMTKMQKGNRQYEKKDYRENHKVYHDNYRPFNKTRMSLDE